MVHIDMRGVRFSAPLWAVYAFVLADTAVTLYIGYLLGGVK